MLSPRLGRVNLTAPPCQAQCGNGCVSMRFSCQMGKAKDGGALVEFKQTLAEITNDQSTQDDAEDAFPQQTDLKLQRVRPPPAMRFLCVLFIFAPNSALFQVHHGNQRGSRRHSFPSHETALTECQQHTPSHQRRQSVGTLAHHDVAAEEVRHLFVGERGVASL